MSDYGVTNSGFILKRLENIASDMRTNAQNQLPGIDTSVDAVPGTMIDVVADAAAEQWQLAQQTYNARFPSTAQGNQLDFIGQITAILRLDPRKSSIKLGYEGVNGTFIPSSNQIKSDAGDIYESLMITQLDDTITNRVEIEIITVLNNHLYTIFIDSNSVDYLSSGSATIEEITTGIISAVNIVTSLLLVNASVIDASLGTFNITSNDGEFAFEVGLNSDFQLNKFWTPIKIQAQVVGPLEALAGTITTIITPVAVLNSVYNFTDVLVGDFLQSDDDYRLRLFQEVRRLGGGSLEAIKDRILNNVEDVISVRAFENHTLLIEPVTLRPPKSIELLVEGGLDLNIAQELWIAKGGGIETFGTENVDITDSQGDIRKIYFSRPVKAYIWFKITLTINSTFPDDGETLVKENIVINGRENYSIGDELLIQQFYCPIYEVTGIDNAVVEMQKTSDLTPPVTYLTTNIKLEDNESPLFDESRVEVIIP